MERVFVIAKGELRMFLRPYPLVHRQDSVRAIENTEVDAGIEKDRLRSRFPGNKECNSQVSGRKGSHLSTKLQT